MPHRSPPPSQPPGRDKSLKASVLGVGAELLQRSAPLKGFDLHLVGFHCAKHDPALQMEAHHYCRQVNEDFIQCVLFDGDTEDANLIGVEYIVSEGLFAELSSDERRYWHPHNFEILSGTLVAPGLPPAAEKAMLKLLMNSYGKVWHLWHTGTLTEGPADRLPLGEPTLMWSFNREGELRPNLRDDVANRVGVSFHERREQRADLARLARPQEGVDALKGRFPEAAKEPPQGVRDAREGGEAPMGGGPP